MSTIFTRNLRGPLRLWSVTLAMGWVILATASLQARPPSFLDTRSDEFLNVVGTVPLKDEVLKDRIVVFFDDPIVQPGVGSRVTKGIVPGLFSIRPPLNGEFKLQDNAISFLPRNATRDELYHLTLAPKIKSVNGRSVNPAHREILIPGAPFQLQRLWVLKESPKRLLLALLFPFPIDQQTLGEYLNIRSNTGEPVPHQLKPTDNPKSARLLVDTPSNYPLKITITKGFPDKTGHFHTQSDSTRYYPSDRFIQVRDISWGKFTRNTQELILRFSKIVDVGALKDHLTITDAKTDNIVPYMLISNKEGKKHTISISLPTPEKAKITVTISKGLTNKHGATLHQTYETTLEYRSSPLLINYTSWRDRQKKGVVLQVALTKDIRPFVPIEQLRSHLEIDPELPNMRVEYGQAWRGPLLIYGDWVEKTSYQIILKAGLPCGEVSTLHKPITRFVELKSARPWVGFSHEGQYYFPRRDGIALPVYTRNASTIHLVLYRLFPSNIVVSLKDFRNGSPSPRFNNSWCERITTVDIPVTDPTSRLDTTSINLDPLFPENRRGVFCLQATVRKERQTASAAKILLFTDIGVLAHWQSDELVLFAHDLYSLTPLVSAKVTVYSRKNQFLADARTDAQGMVYLNKLNRLWGEPAVAVVEYHNDSTFLELAPRDRNIREIRSGMPRYNRDAYDAFIYADRDLYRPGETAHLRWIVRTHYGDALSNVPLLVTVFKPNGKKLLSKPTTLSTFGTDGLDLHTQRVYPTGAYQVHLNVPGSKTIIGSYSFRLEEFVPYRMKAAVQIPETRWLAGREYAISVHANHLFGAPAVDRKCGVKLHFRRGGFSSKKWKAYRFDNDSKYVPESISLGESKTNPQGVADFKFTYTPNAKVTFPLTASVVGQVFELGGRAVIARKSAVLVPSDILLGVSANNLPSGELEIHAVAIRFDESPAPIENVTVTLERQTWNYYVRRYYTNNQPSWTQSFETVEKREVNLQNGSGSTRFKIEGYGYYRVRVHSDQTPQYSTLSFYSYGGRCKRVDAARPSLIKLSLDKSEYNVGDKATLRIESPFDGQGIVVLQSDTIKKMIPVQIEDHDAVITIPLTEADYPNLWVEATVIHAIREGRASMVPFSSFAVANVPVNNPKRKIQVTIPELPKEIRPETTMAFSIETRDSTGQPVEAELTLAAVDEGIHAITNYRSPDPYAYFARSRRPDLRRAHYYDRVVYDFEKVQPGGGRGAELAKRATSGLENWIKPVALWSGVVQTNSDGRATVRMEIPEFTGQLRLVVVACTENSVGAYSAPLLARRLHMLRTSMPRFMLPGDSAQCRAVVFNNSDAACRAVGHWRTSGALRPSTGEISLNVPAHAEKNYFANVIAGHLPGQGKIVWNVTIFNATGEKLDDLTEQAPLPVPPPAAFQSHHEIRIATPGQTLEVRNTQFLNDSRAEIHVTVGANPALQLEDALKYLLDYPYGCVEQTTSRLLPLYVLRQNADLMEPVIKNRQWLDSYIQSGIDRLFAMQTPSGGMAFWPGGQIAYPYGSIYAFHFLTLLKKGREYELPLDNYQSLKNYVRKTAMDWHDSSSGSSVLYERAYALYTLALGGDLDAIQQISRFDSIVLPRAARLLLAAALAQSTKDRDRIALYLSRTPSKPYLISEPDKTLNSDIRNTAIELLALREMEADPAKIAEKAHKLTTFLHNNRHGTTQETAFIVTALSQYLNDIATHIDEASAEVEYSNRKRVTKITGPEVYRAHHTGPDGLFIVRNTGGTDIIVNINTRGIPRKANTEPVSEGIHIHRTLYSNNALPLNNMEFQQGETYVVALNLSCDQNVKNLIIADLLPGGFEVDNPRLDPDAVPEGKLPGASAPSYLDIRDDRIIVAFDQLKKGSHHFYYVVRAVTPGTYQYPPVEAECMYVPSVHGSSGLSSITVM